MLMYVSSATMQFQGKHIRVDMATAPRKVAKPGEENESEYDRSRTVFVGNVPFDVEVVTLVAHMLKEYMHAVAACSITEL